MIKALQVLRIHLLELEKVNFYSCFVCVLVLITTSSNCVQTNLKLENRSIVRTFPRKYTQIFRVSITLNATEEKLHLVL